MATLKCSVLTIVVASIATILLFCVAYFEKLGNLSRLGGNKPRVQHVAATHAGAHLPSELLRTVYNESDFVNAHHVHPPFWTCMGGNCNSSDVWGPCYAPHNVVDWSKAISDYQHTHRPVYYKRREDKGLPDKSDLSNLCRPGFIIIGAGKCGTSSLYHYITDHPRVLPAKEKQIHYFKYYLNFPMQWYLWHFPTAKSFLAAGALMTGEASPGYLPYPDVAHMVRQLLPGPRIIAVGREPIDRAYSSYRYNYVTPAIELMRRGRIKGIQKRQPKEFYEQYLFSFEDMVKAELKVLRECFAPDGPGIVGARKAWGDKPWFKSEFDRREKMGEPPLVDLDGYCYGNQVNKTVLRRQWAELQARYPEKVIPDQNLFLTQSFIGRGLYTLPLEWWYATFPREDIYFICTEELSDVSGEPMNKLGHFLGLPEYNFSTIVKAGAYNVGGHKGYDKEVSWETVEQETELNGTKHEIPLSDELRSELSDFVRPFNERLFALTGRRCQW